MIWDITCRSGRAADKVRNPTGYRPVGLTNRADMEVMARMASQSTDRAIITASYWFTVKDTTVVETEDMT